MITVLIAHGPNSISTPCRIFPSLEDGKKKCDKIFGIKSERRKIGSKDYFLYDKELREDDKELSEILFTHYYYGCGEPYQFSLLEVDFDTKFVAFDLD